MTSQYGFIRKYQDQLVHCSRCGFCQVSCPVYGVTLRPALNPRGKMLILKDLLEGRLSLRDELLDGLYQCTGCAVCAQNCPAGVKVAEILKEARKDMVREGFLHPAFQGLSEALEYRKNIYGEEKPGAFSHQKKNQKAEIVYFTGCVGLFRESGSIQQTLSLLDRLKVDYTLIDEVCCSGVLEQGGFEVNTSLADHNIKSIMDTGAKTVLTECPFCFRTFTEKPQYNIFKEKDIEVMPLIRFLREINFGVTTDKRVTYHDPCDLGRHSGMVDDPRQVIRKLAPDFVEMAHNREEALCCGAGGGMRGAYPGISIAMAGLRLQEAVAIDADILLTNCNSCIHNLKNAQKRYSRLRKHKIELYNLSHFINVLLDQTC